MFTDEHRCDVCSRIRQQDIRAFTRFLTAAVFLETVARTGQRIAKSPLHLINLVYLGVAAALHPKESFDTVLTMTLKLLEDQQQFPQSELGKAKKKGKSKKSHPSKQDPRENDPTVVSEEAFAQARQRMPLEFWITLIIVLGERFEAEHGARHCFRDFRVLAMDGTRIDLPNWKENRKHFGAARNKTGIHNVQARMVMMQFPFTRVPFRYELTPLAEGEITLALRLVQHLRPGDLVLLDAGYWSYGLLQAIAVRGAFFAIRSSCKLVKRTVRLLEASGKDKVIRWTPKDTRHKWRKLGLPRSIDMRMVEYRVPGFRIQRIATNVLKPEQISRADWTRLTVDCADAGRKLLPGLFHRRWEIETSYYELKVHQGMDRHLRGRTPATIQYEVAGHVVLYLLTRSLMVEAAAKHGLDPLRLSFIEAQRELEVIRASLVLASVFWATHILIPRLLDRIAQHEVVSRPGRHYPRKKKNRRSTKRTKSSKLKTKA
jgi:DDE family transposase